jgi:predicted nicotinamide N-methyase
LDDPLKLQNARAVEARLAKLPIEVIEVAAGGRQWSLEAVRDHGALLEASDEMGAFPFGLLLWESALVLSDVLYERRAGIADARVLDVGAGVGLQGLVAASLGAEVTQNDASPEALALCRRNAVRNGVAGITWQQCDWTLWTDRARYDLIIGSDVLYESEGHDALIAILAANLAPSGELWITDPGRPLTPWFLGKLETAGWNVWQETRTVPVLIPLSPAETVDVTVYAARRG